MHQTRPVAKRQPIGQTSRGERTTWRALAVLATRIERRGLEADREFVLGATADFDFDFVDLGFDLSRAWYNGMTSAIDLAISAAFGIGDAAAVTPGVNFEWTGGPPAISLSLDVDVAVGDSLTITPGLTMDVPGGATLGLSLDAEYAVRPNLSLSAGVSYEIGGGLGASVGFTIGFGG